MLNRFYAAAVVLVVGLGVLKLARTSDAIQSADPSPAPIPAELVWQPAPPLGRVSSPPSAAPSQSAGQQPSYTSQALSQGQSLPAVAMRTDIAPAVSPQYPQTYPSQGVPMPPAPAAPLPAPQSNAGLTQPTAPNADGTWRDDGRYIIINIDGREMKLLKSNSDPRQARQSEPIPPERPPLELPTPLPAVPPGDVTGLPPTGPETIGVGPVLGDSSPAPIVTVTGTVHGRLLQKGYPVSNCHVVIVPWPKGNKSDASLDARMPLVTMTDDEGCYCFEHVPLGEYKLTWLPAGARSWIRRIAMRPDVIVHEGQDVALKDIRMALQTIN